jgi:hypothetical protein
MTLIAVYTSDGCVGRCDARCYNATSSSCDCICRGMNHAKGLTVARDLTSDAVISKLGDEWCKEHGIERRSARVESSVQRELFQDDRRAESEVH